MKRSYFRINNNKNIVVQLLLLFLIVLLSSLSLSSNVQADQIITKTIALPSDLGPSSKDPSNPGTYKFQTQRYPEQVRISFANTIDWLNYNNTKILITNTNIVDIQIQGDNIVLYDINIIISNCNLTSVSYLTHNNNNRLNLQLSSSITIQNCMLKPLTTKSNKNRQAFSFKLYMQSKRATFSVINNTYLRGPSLPVQWYGSPQYPIDLYHDGASAISIGIDSMLSSSNNGLEHPISFDSIIIANNTIIIDPSVPQEEIFDTNYAAFIATYTTTSTTTNSQKNICINENNFIRQMIKVRIQNELDYNKAENKLKEPLANNVVISNNTFKLSGGCISQEFTAAHTAFDLIHFQTVNNLHEFPLQNLIVENNQVVFTQISGFPNNWYSFRVFLFDLFLLKDFADKIYVQNNFVFFEPTNDARRWIMNFQKKKLDDISTTNEDVAQISCFQIYQSQPFRKLFFSKNSFLVDYPCARIDMVYHMTYMEVSVPVYGKNNAGEIVPKNHYDVDEFPDFVLGQNFTFAENKMETFFSDNENDVDFATTTAQPNELSKFITTRADQAQMFRCGQARLASGDKVSQGSSYFGSFNYFIFQDNVANLFSTGDCGGCRFRGSFRQAFHFYAFRNQIVCDRFVTNNQRVEKSISGIQFYLSTAYIEDVIFENNSVRLVYPDIDKFAGALHFQLLYDKMIQDNVSSKYGTMRSAILVHKNNNVSLTIVATTTLIGDGENYGKSGELRLDCGVCFASAKGFTAFFSWMVEGNFVAAYTNGATSWTQGLSLVLLQNLLVIGPVEDGHHRVFEGFDGIKVINNDFIIRASRGGSLFGLSVFLGGNSFKMNFDINNPASAAFLKYKKVETANVKFPNFGYLDCENNVVDFSSEVEDLFTDSQIKNPSSVKYYSNCFDHINNIFKTEEIHSSFSSSPSLLREHFQFLQDSLFCSSKKPEKLFNFPQPPELLLKPQWTTKPHPANAPLNQLLTAVFAVGFCGLVQLENITFRNNLIKQLPTKTNPNPYTTNALLSLGAPFERTPMFIPPGGIISGFIYIYATCTAPSVIQLSSSGSGIIIENNTILKGNANIFSALRCALQSPLIKISDMKVFSAGFLSSSTQQNSLFQFYQQQTKVQFEKRLSVIELDPEFQIFDDTPQVVTDFLQQSNATFFVQNIVIENSHFDLLPPSPDSFQFSSSNTNNNNNIVNLPGIINAPKFSVNYISISNTNYSYSGCEFFLLSSSTKNNNNNNNFVRTLASKSYNFNLISTSLDSTKTKNSNTAATAYATTTATTKIFTFVNISKVDVCGVDFSSIGTSSPSSITTTTTNSLFRQDLTKKQDILSSSTSTKLFSSDIFCFNFNHKPVAGSSSSNLFPLAESDGKFSKNFPKIKICPNVFLTTTKTISLQETKSVEDVTKTSSKTMTASRTHHAITKQEAFQIPSAAKTFISVAGSLFPSVSAVQGAFRAMTSTTIRQCGNSSIVENSPLTFDSNVFMMEIGSDKNDMLRTFRGALIGNVLLIFIVWVILMMIVVYLMKTKKRKQHQQQNRSKKTTTSASASTMRKQEERRETSSTSSRNKFGQKKNSSEKNKNCKENENDDVDDVEENEEDQFISYEEAKRWIRFPSSIFPVIIAFGLPTVVVFAAIASVPSLAGSGGGGDGGGKQEKIFPVFSETDHEEIIGIKKLIKNDFDVVIGIPSVLIFIVLPVIVGVYIIRTILGRGEKLIENKNFYSSSQKENLNTSKKRSAASSSNRNSKNNKEDSSSSSSSSSSFTNKFIIIPISKLTHYLLEQWMIYVDTEFVQKYGLIFDSYKTSWFALFDFLTAVIMAICAGVSLNCTTKSCCNSSAVMCLVVSFFHTVICLLPKTRPFMNRLETFCISSLSVVTFILCIMQIMELSGVTAVTDLLNIFTTISVVVSFSAIFVNALPIVAPISKVVFKYLKKKILGIEEEDEEDDKDEEEGKQNNKKKESSSSSSGDSRRSRKRNENNVDLEENLLYDNRNHGNINNNNNINRKKHFHLSQFSEYSQSEQQQQHDDDDEEEMQSKRNFSSSSSSRNRFYDDDGDSSYNSNNRRRSNYENQRQNRSQQNQKNNNYRDAVKISEMLISPLANSSPSSSSANSQILGKSVRSDPRSARQQKQQQQQKEQYTNNNNSRSRSGSSRNRRGASSSPRTSQHQVLRGSALMTELEKKNSKRYSLL